MSYSEYEVSYRCDGNLRDTVERRYSSELLRPIIVGCQCAALMPDGTWVDYPEGGIIPEGSLERLARREAHQ